MYVKWAEKQGHKTRVLEKCSSNSGGIKSVTIEFEFKYAYGFLIGERGVHRMMSSLEKTSNHEVQFAVTFKLFSVYLLKRIYHNQRIQFLRKS